MDYLISGHEISTVILSLRKIQILAELHRDIGEVLPRRGEHIPFHLREIHLLNCCFYQSQKEKLMRDQLVFLFLLA